MHIFTSYYYENVLFDWKILTTTLVCCLLSFPFILQYFNLQGRSRVFWTVLGSSSEIHYIVVWFWLYLMGVKRMKNNNNSRNFHANKNHNVLMLMMQSNRVYFATWKAWLFKENRSWHFELFIGKSDILDT